MSNKGSLGKSYPKQITIDGMEFTQSPDELYVELVPQLREVEIEQFLTERKNVIEWQFEPTNRRMLTLQQFNRSSVHAKWVHLTGREETIEPLIGQLESEELVRQVAPVYFREDLKHPNGFTFTDEIIVKFNVDVQEEQLMTVFREMGVEKVEGPRGNLGKRMLLLRVLDTKARNTYEVARSLAEMDGIESAKVNMIQLHRAIFAIPNDTYFTNQWNLRNTGQTMPDGNVGVAGSDINVEPAWDISKGSPLVVIAILDTGCDLGHDDLLPHYVQPDQWYNAHTGTNSPDDDEGHGTCCAGIASSKTNSLSARGVAGVGWHCRIMPIRMIWNSGYGISEAAILTALNHALNNHANVISMSWRWDGVQTDIDTALQDCFDEGIVLVAAAGNYAGLYPDTILYPANNLNVIAVGATNENDGRCTNLDWTGATYLGSQYGPELSVVAPGVHTWSTDMRGTGQGYNSTRGGGDTAGDYFEDFGGTSGATPHVAGLAGLILAYNPTLTPTQVRTIIENTADDMVGDPTEDVAGWDKYMGHGRINAGAALLEVQTNHPFSPADVYIRDSLTDTGAEPYIGLPLCYSPDIIIRKNPVTDPQTDFADMTVDPGSDKVEIGNDNYIYVRVHNKGTVDSDIHVSVYYAPLTTTCGPDLWEYIGQIDFYDVLAGSSAVSDALIWENVPDPGSVGHYCLIASIEGFSDPHPDPDGISNATQYMQFIRDHNNICYRNLVFEDVLPNTMFTTNFIVGGLFDNVNKFDLRIEQEAPMPKPEVYLELHGSIFKAHRAYLDNMIEHAGVRNALKGYRLFELKKEMRAEIKGLIVPPRSRNMARLNVRIPDDVEPGEIYQFTVQQVFDGEVIGDFQVVARVVDPQHIKYIAVKGSRLVHKADCEALLQVDREFWVPFETLEDARAAGYDMALDCLNQPFEVKDISYRLVRKVLDFVNRVELAEDLHYTVKDTLGIGYFDGRYGKQEAKKRGYGIGIETAEKILRARDKRGRFTKLEDIVSVEGVGIDKFIDLVNTFK